MRSSSSKAQSPSQLQTLLHQLLPPWVGRWMLLLLVVVAVTAHHNSARSCREHCQQQHLQLQQQRKHRQQLLLLLLCRLCSCPCQAPLASETPQTLPWVLVSVSHWTLLQPAAAGQPAGQLAGTGTAGTVMRTAVAVAAAGMFPPLLLLSLLWVLVLLHPGGSGRLGCRPVLVLLPLGRLLLQLFLEDPPLKEADLGYQGMRRTLNP